MYKEDENVHKHTRIIILLWIVVVFALAATCQSCVDTSHSDAVIEKQEAAIDLKDSLDEANTCMDCQIEMMNSGCNPDSAKKQCERIYYGK